MMELALYLLTGVAAGLSAGLLGIGGGLIIVPVLYFIFTQQGMPSAQVMHVALATSLATIIVTSISSARAHHQRGAVLWPLVRQLTPGIIIGAWLGGMLAGQLTTSILRPVFGIFELLVAFHLLTNYKPQIHAAHVSTGKTIIGGLVIGNISAIVGIGGGTLTVPFLMWHNIHIKNAVASSAACGFPIAVAGTVAYVISGWEYTDLSSYTLGYVNLTAFVMIIITSILAAPAGVHIAHKLPEKSLRTVFAILLLLLGLKMLLF